MDWIDQFQPAAPSDDDARSPATPVVFESKAHALIILDLRERAGQQIVNPEDKALAEVHDRVGYQGDDRRDNGTDKPTELSPFGDVIDDDDGYDALQGWNLKEELEDFRAGRLTFLFPFRREAA